MAKFHTDEELRKHYEHYLLYKKSRLGTTMFCKVNNIEPNPFLHFLKRYDYIIKTNPQEYKRVIGIALDLMTRRANPPPNTIRHTLTFDKYLEFYKPDIPLYKLKDAYYHLEIRDRISKITGAKVNKPQESELIFLELEPTSDMIKQAIPETVICDTILPITDEPKPKENDIELHINSGIFITIKPIVPTAKVTKLIDILRGL
jgi:hypothetical protein